MDKPLVYIIVLNWNGKHLLFDCLNSLKNVNYENCKILLVDNASIDGSVGYVKSEFPKIEILELKQNYGFAKGNNLGFEYAQSRGAEFIIFLNNDTFVEENFINHLLEPFKDQNVGQTVPKIYYADEKEKIWYSGGKINFWIGNIYHEGIRKLDKKKYSTNKQTDYATGCCFCMKVSVFEKVNGFDESFPMYAEDADISLRIRELGKIIIYAPESNIWHKVSSSIGGELSFQKIIRKYKGYLKLYSLHANILQWGTTALCSPFLLLTNVLKYVRLRFFNE